MWRILAYGRRYSVPAIHHGFQPVHQSQPAQRCNVEPQMLQGYPQMGGNQYQQCMGQSIDPDLLAPPLLTPIMIPTTHGGSSPSKNSASPTNTPWYTPQSTPPPPQRLSPGFQSVSFHRRLERRVLTWVWGSGIAPTFESSRWQTC